MSWLSRLFRRRDSDPVEPIADPEDPAVALAMKIVAQERAGDEDIEAELAEAKAVFDAAPDEARAEAMERLAKASIRAALAREARKRYET